VTVQLGLDGVAAIQFGCQPKTLLEVLELGDSSPDQVVGTAARALEVLGELGDRPVLVEMEAAGLALVVGEQATEHVEETLMAPVTGGARGGRASWCQGQSLDIVTEHCERSEAQTERVCHMPASRMVEQSRP